MNRPEQLRLTLPAYRECAYVRTRVRSEISPSLLIAFHIVSCLSRMPRSTLIGVYEVERPKSSGTAISAGGRGGSVCERRQP